MRATVEAGFADRVLDGAQLAPGMTLVDIGSGDGLIPFRAIDRIGPSLRVILVDISAPLLRHAESLAIERGVCEQCTFLELSAEKLSEIADASVDVVTTRAVLAYIGDKSAALREFKRILKPGGRVSSAEPIFRDDALKAIALRKAIESPGPESQDRLVALLHRWKAAQFPDTEEQMAASPITNYSERDLVQMAVSLGLCQKPATGHCRLMYCCLLSVTTWDTFIGFFAASPSAPFARYDSGRAIRAAEERQFFEQSIRPVVEARQFITTDRVAYLTARKPLALTSVTLVRRDSRRGNCSLRGEATAQLRQCRR